jgi:AbrB family looped-hinge helix DNA binding protein
MTTLIPIDKAGRLVLPKEIRARLDIGAGDILEAEWGGDEIRLRVRHETPATTMRQGKRTVWNAPGSKLSPDEWDEALQRGRKERDKRASSGFRES